MLLSILVHVVGASELDFPEEVVEMLGWKEETTLKIEVGRDFDLNATTIVITKKG